MSTGELGDCNWKKKRSRPGGGISPPQKPIAATGDLLKRDQLKALGFRFTTPKSTPIPKYRDNKITDTVRRSSDLRTGSTRKATCCGRSSLLDTRAVGTCPVDKFRDAACAKSAEAQPLASFQRKACATKQGLLRMAHPSRLNIETDVYLECQM